MNILEVRNLVKHYGDVRAVNGVSLAIPQGICFGLLGPNGAGKTTTIEIIEGITQATSGEILFKGKPTGEDFREHSGIQFQATTLQDYITVREAIRMFGAFYKKTLPLERLSQLCNLGEFLDRDTSKLSGGQLQRVLLAISLVNDPEILFLDEPTTGLDPQARRNFWEMINGIKEQKKTIVLTTHYMEEAYELCDQIAIMDRGKIIAQGAPDALLKQHFDGVTIQIPKEDFGSKTPPSLPGTVSEKDGIVAILTNQVNSVLKLLLDHGVSLNRMKLRDQTLEDLFLELTGKELRT